MIYLQGSSEEPDSHAPSIPTPVETTLATTTNPRTIAKINRFIASPPVVSSLSPGVLLNAPAGLPLSQDQS